jgi:DNA-binding CsgD family transcriptional regulator
MLEFNIWNSFHFLRINSDCFESWLFGSEKDQSEIQEFCIRNQGLLLKFVHYFNNAAKEIIEVNKTDDHKLAIYQDGINYPNKTILIKDEQLSENFLKELKDRNEILFKKVGKSWLTHREIDCLSYLAKGQTAKQIARNLNLSVRTVETYLTRIKTKTNLTLRSDLIKFYQDNLF